jgi:hypothetical protein
MKFTLCTAIRIRSLFVNARTLPVGIAMILNAHLASLAWTQTPSFGACGSNICSSPTSASVGIGIPTTSAPVQKLHTEGNIAIAADYQTIGNGNARYIGVPGVNGAFNQSAGAYLIFYQGGDNGLSPGFTL